VVLCVVRYCVISGCVVIPFCEMLFYVIQGYVMLCAVM